MIAIISLVFCILYFVFFPSYISVINGAQVSQKKLKISKSHQQQHHHQHLITSQTFIFAKKKMDLKSLIKT
jgi:hypothetical protein